MTESTGATTTQDAGATAGAGTTAATESLSAEAKQIIGGLNKANSKQFETIKAVAEAMGIDVKDLSAEKAKELIGKVQTENKTNADKESTSLGDRMAALAEFIEDDRYQPVLKTLRQLAKDGIKPTQALADTLLATVEPTASGPRSTGGSSGKITSTTEPETAEYLKTHNLWGEQIGTK